MNIRNNLDLTLKTQVLHTGQIVLLGLDKWGYERLHLEMNKSATGERIAIQQAPTARKNSWMPVVEETDNDDITSLGDQSSMQSPMSNVSQSKIFVPQYLGM